MHSGTIKSYLVLIPKLVTIKTQTLTTPFVVAVKKFAYAHIFEKEKKETTNLKYIHNSTRSIMKRLK